MVSYRVNLLILVILLSFVFNLGFVQASLDINFTNPSPFSGEIVYGDLLINITFSTADNATIYLFNSTKDQINSSFSTTSSFTANFSNLSSGVYYFNATATNSSSDMNSTLTRNIVLVNSNLTGDGSVKSSYKINESRFGNGNELGGDLFGFSVANIGDLNGDGVQDLVVGEPRNKDGGVIGNFPNGAVWILFLNTTGGVDSEYLINESSLSIDLDGDFFGISVANLGDLNNDGVQDLAVGEYRNDDGGTSNGAVWILFLNTTGGVIDEYKINESRFGNGNELDGDYFGISVANLGDLNNDGVQDLAVGEYRNDDGGTSNGAVWILFLNTTGGVDSEYKINESRFGNGNELDGDYFGISVANLGDLNNDGVQDLAVGEYLNDDGGTSNGAVWILFLNTTGGVIDEYKINESRFGNGNELDGDYFGISVANLGDLNNDGVQDLAVGEYLNDDGGTSNGAVWILFLNTTGGVKSEYKINESRFGNGSELEGGEFGGSLTNLGDLNNDGIQDLAVGESGSEDGGSDNGAVWLLFLDSIDTTSPEINITFPITNNSNHSSNGIDINYTRSDDVALDSCWYSNDTYSVNTTLVSCVNITGTIWSEGLHNLTIYVNDTSNNVNSSTISFTIDTVEEVEEESSGGGAASGSVKTAAPSAEEEAEGEEVEEETEEEIDEELEELEEEVEEEFVCGQWSECNAVYGIDDLGGEGVDLKGERTRVCSNSEIEEIQRSSCSVAKKVSVTKKEDGKVEVLDEGGEVVAGLRLFEENGVEKLDLVLFLGGEGSDKGLEELDDRSNNEISEKGFDSEINIDEEGSINEGRYSNFLDKLINYPVYIERIGNRLVFPIAFF